MQPPRNALVAAGVMDARLVPLLSTESGADPALTGSTHPDRDGAGAHPHALAAGDRHGCGPAAHRRRRPPATAGGLDDVRPRGTASGWPAGGPKGCGGSASPRGAPYGRCCATPPPYSPSAPSSPTSYDPTCRRGRTCNHQEDSHDRADATPRRAGARRRARRDRPHRRPAEAAAVEAVAVGCGHVRAGRHARRRHRDHPQVRGQPPARRDRGRHAGDGSCAAAARRTRYGEVVALGAPGRRDLGELDPPRTRHGRHARGGRPVRLELRPPHRRGPVAGGAGPLNP